MSRHVCTKPFFVLVIVFPLFSGACTRESQSPSKVVTGIDGGTESKSSEGDSTETGSELDAKESVVPPILFEAPEFKLTDQHGQLFRSQELEGRVWIANFIFTRCLATCPRQSASLAALQTRISQWPHAHRVRMLSITVDPEHDSPQQLLEYANRYDANHERWKFLTGKRADLWQLSKDGFKFPVSANALDQANPVTHSPRFVLVDAQGRVRGLYNSQLDEELEKLVEELQILLSEPIDNPPDAVAIGVPADVFDPVWLSSRGKEQVAKAAEIKAFHDFQFEDRSEESGITFVNRPVADAAKDFKSNHYDHANGIAAADVDGDGLIDLYFTSQRGRNELWKNLGGGRFEDITESAGVGLVDRVSVAASFADIDNDGDPDLFVTTTRHGNALFNNDGQGRFKDVTVESGVAYSGHSSSADFFDYDNDGLLDLLVTNVGQFTSEAVGYSGKREQQEDPYYVGTNDSFGGHLFPSLSEPSILYHNEGNGRFTNVSNEMGFRHRAWSGDATPIDINKDGWMDLYILNMQGNDVYYENIGGVRFEDKSRDVFPTSVWGGMGVKSFDYNNDGLMDLYVTNMHADMWQLKLNILGAEVEKRRAPPNTVPESYLQSRTPWKNVIGSGLFVRRPSGGFDEIATNVNADNYWPWGPSVGDLNADGFQDIFVASSMNYPYRYHVNSLLLNDEGKTFRDAEFILGIEPRSGPTAVPWYTLDCDGVDAKHEHSEGRSGAVEVWGAVGTRSAVIFDVDSDGDLDIVTIEFNSRPRVLLSNLSEQMTDMRYLVVKLQGKSSNRDGLGARVEVKTGDRVLTQVHDGQSGYLSQSALPLTFGLGDAAAIDAITIHWPGSKSQTIEGPIESNQVLLIEQE